MANNPSIPAEHFAALFRAVPEPLLVLLPDAQFTIVDVNDSYLKETLATRSDLIGRGVFDAFPDNPSTPEAQSTTKLRASLERVLSLRQPDTMAVQRYDVPRRDGQGFELRYWCPVNSPVFGPGGQLLYILHRVQNVTEYVLLQRDNENHARENARMEAEIVQRSHDLDARNAELRRANEALTAYAHQKDEFLAMLAHELRNPMAGISNALEVLTLVGAQDEQARRLREVCRRQLGHLVRLVDDLLDVSRISRGTVELRCAPIDLADVVRSVAEATGGLFRQRQVELAVALAPGGFPLEGDATRLEQVLANLLSNALKYSEPGGAVTLSLAPCERDGRRLARVEVRDEGRGIPPHMLSSIFEMFVQADTSIDRARGGLGIGLTLARRLVEMHGGTLEADSQGPGTGSTFTLCLPLAPAAAPAHRASRPGGLAAPARRVLVVEDNADARETLVALLGVFGHEVAAAADGEQGLARLVELRPDVAFVDVGLPGMDGLELARRARAAGLSDVLLVGLSGYGGPEQEAVAARAGFNRYLVKPVDLERLGAVLAETGEKAP